ncbi:MAG TPA: copper resistance CopC family protein [Methylophilaceae bacterium]|nr:copper resistance CopC family protein [Methylophilaceae bacterium]
MNRVGIRQGIKAGSTTRNAFSHIGALLCILLLLSPSVSQAHTRLLFSDPAAGAVLKTAPARVLLRFSAPPEKGFSELQWSHAKDEKWETLQVQQQARQLEGTLPSLAPGRYKIRWSVLSRDGHRQRGVLQFQID